MPARINPFGQGNLFFVGRRKKDCSARPDEPFRTGLAWPVAAAAWGTPKKELQKIK